MARISKSIKTSVTLHVLLICSASACVELYGQCGGVNYSGPTCCVQPTPIPGVVNFIPRDSNVCSKVNEYYSQCIPRCPSEMPCLFLPTGECISSSDFLGELSTDGRGREYCGGPFVACPNPSICYSDPISCICGGNVPCALTSRPGGCVAEVFDASAGRKLCGPGSRRCPAFEHQQCGGSDHIEPTECQPGLKCVEFSPYFSSCQLA